MYANKHTPHHTSFGERIILYLRKTIGRIQAHGQHRSAVHAVRIAVNSYNATPNRALGGKLAPRDVNDKTIGQVVKYQEISQAEEAATYPVIDKFKEGDLVRWRRAKTRFTKANEPLFHPGIYRIISIKPSVPTPSYVIQNIQSGVTVPGSFDFTQLEHADDQP